MNKLASLVLAPWAITAEGYDLVLRAAHDEKALQKLEGKPHASAPTVEMRDGVAVIPIKGPLAKDEDFMSMLFGSSSYERIRKDFQAALDDDGVTSILFDVDSPGGEVFGASELSKAIYDARGKKKIEAYVSGQCCSAAYWIASAADSIGVDPTSQIGSIGVRSTLLDDSKRDEAQGVREYQIVSTQSPYKVVDAASSADRARVQESLTEMAAVFIADVARNRDVSAKQAQERFGKGDIFIGKAAIAAGMVDSVGDFESLLSSITNGGNMSTKADPSARHLAATVKCDGCAKAIGDGKGTYCEGCYGKASDGDEDEDDEDMDEAKSFRASALAILGVGKVTEAIGVLSALKAQQEEIKSLKAELESSREEKAKAEVTGLIASAISEKRVHASRKEEFEAFAEKFGADALKANLAMYSKHEPARPKVDESKGANGGGTTESTASLPKDILEILANTGVKPEDYLAGKQTIEAKRAAYFAGSADIERGA